jgi:hypothetical protein
MAWHSATTRATSAMPTKKSTRHSSKSGFLGRIAASSRNTASSSAPTSGVHTRGSLPAASTVFFSSIGLENVISHTPVAVKAKNFVQQNRVLP